MVINQSIGTWNKTKAVKSILVDFKSYINIELHDNYQVGTNALDTKKLSTLSKIYISLADLSKMFVSTMLQLNFDIPTVMPIFELTRWYFWFSADKTLIKMFMFDSRTQRAPQWFIKYLFFKFNWVQFNLKVKLCRFYMLIMTGHLTFSDKII